MSARAGWSYLRWNKEFYPKGTADRQKLEYYATRFNAVELNNSFYHVPPPEQFIHWQTQVPSDFRFAVKASRYITHTKKLAEAAEIIPPFTDAVALSPSGPLFFQLPPSFPLNLERLDQWLAALPTGFRYAIELRHPSWHVPEIYQRLRNYKIAFCLFDTPEGVSPRELTADFAYVRLRGRRSQKLGSFLGGWRDYLSESCKTAYVFFDNREEKSLAFGNALEFRALTES